jgi:hypothetical protein
MSGRETGDRTWAGSGGLRELGEGWVMAAIGSERNGPWEAAGATAVGAAAAAAEAGGKNEEEDAGRGEAKGCRIRLWACCCRAEWAATPIESGDAEEGSGGVDDGEADTEEMGYR